MPGSGIITESLPKPSQKASNKWIGRADDASRQCRESELLFPFYRSSYRSGSSYDRFKATDGNKSRTNEASLIEMLLATSGMDVGHDYEVKRFTDVRSNFHFLSEPSSDSAAFFLPGSLAWPTSFGITSAIEGSQVLDYLRFKTGAVSDSTLRAQGTRNINITNPLKPTVTLATSFAELVFDGLPSILGKQILKPGPKRSALIKNAGGEYLNYVFGVLPIVSDIGGIVDILRRGHDIVSQWQRNDGRQIRRRRTWDGPSTRDRYDFDLYHPAANYITGVAPSPTTKIAVGNGLSSGLGGQYGTINAYTEESIQYSFSAAFNYDLDKLIPDYPEPIKEVMFGSHSRDEIIEVILQQHLYGLDPKTATSADTVWNVLPFSWLIDWFVNIGDLIANVTAFQTQGLVLDYGYMSVTQNRRFTATYDWTRNGLRSAGTTSLSAYRKRRLRATPFGFANSFGGLTTGQSAILASLAAGRIR